MRLWHIVLVGGWIVGSVGCSSGDESTSEPQGGSAGAAGSSAGVGGNAGSAGQVSSGGCPTLGGAMIRLPAGFCIDKLEVTRDAYRDWLETNPPITGQPAECSWNTDYVFEADCMARAEVCKGSACGQDPQTCVDWCDARAFCAAMGKRLCGQIGGGAAAFDTYADAQTDQWMNACSSGGKYTYVYGNQYEAETCNALENPDWGQSHGATRPAPLDDMADCQSPDPAYAGVFNLSGNVWEWEDSCQELSANMDVCRLRGGSLLSQGGTLSRCDTEYHNDRNKILSTVGFRCCL